MTEATYNIAELQDVFPKANNTTVTLGEGGLNETITAIIKIINYNYKKMLPFARKIQGDTLEQTAFNIWDFIKEHTTYQKDKPKTEQLRTPQRLIHDGIGDCDDYTIFAAAVLKALGYNPYLYIVAFNGLKNYGHIYAGIDNLIIDGVMNEYGKHPDNITKTLIIDLKGGRKEFFRSPEHINITSMLLQQLSGLDRETQTALIDDELTRLNGIENLTENEIEDFNKVRTLKLLEGDDMRDFITEIMPIAGIDDDMNIYFEDQETADEIDSLYDEFMNLSGLGDVDGLGKLFDKLKKFVKKTRTKIKETRKKHISKIKDAHKKRVEKVKKIAKKVTKGVKKVSLAPARGAMLLLLRLNMFKWGSRLWLSYLPADKVNEYGMDAEAFKKLVEFRKKFESFWVKMGGDKKAIFQAVSKRGRDKAKKEYGINGLGLAPVAAAAAPAAASPFLAFLGGAWKGIKAIFSKLFKKGGFKKGAGMIKEAYNEYKEAKADTDAMQDEMIEKALDDGGSGYTDPKDEPGKSGLLIPALIGAGLLFLI
jgi:hypothetical protein